MPKITVSNHGLTAAIPPTMDPERKIGGQRGTIGGWSLAATRRNTEFLRSVDVSRLSGAGVALTLTLRDCPPTSEDWHRIRRAWIERIRRQGMVRLHWVTEWQRRGVPHLHCAVWWPDAYWIGPAVQAWLDVAAPYGAGIRGQHGRPIDGAVGWFQYLAKHASRGVKHYQRSKEGMPEEWKERTGRVWGHVGEWPTQKPVEISMEGREGDGGWYVFRRLVKRWRLADARAAGDWKRLAYGRRILKLPRARSETRPMSEWISKSQTRLMLEHLAGMGYVVKQYEKAAPPPAGCDPSSDAAQGMPTPVGGA